MSCGPSETWRCRPKENFHVYRWNPTAKKPMRRCDCGAKRNFIYEPTGFVDWLKWRLGF